MRVRRLHKAPAHLEITAFINLIVVLVPFLLSTAVFSRLAVMDMTLPGPSNAVEQLKGNDLKLEVVIRRDALEVGDRIGGLIQRIPVAAGGAQDTQALTGLLVQVKAKFPEVVDASVLAEPDTAYDQIVQVMDAMRSTHLPNAPQGQRSELFPNIAIGDAPVRKTPA
ncbi:MAG: biopolymer transporter ExbD [Rubrivivax sp.]